MENGYNIEMSAATLPGVADNSFALSILHLGILLLLVNLLLVLGLLR